MLCANACGFILFQWPGIGVYSVQVSSVVTYACCDKNRPMWIGTEPTSGLECIGHRTTMIGGGDENGQINSRL